MEKLTKREDQIMQIIWDLKTAFIRDVIERLPEPKPHYNSVVKKKFFGNSFPKMMAYFAKEENLSEEELSELIEVIKSNKSK